MLVVGDETWIEALAVHVHCISLGVCIYACGRRSNALGDAGQTWCGNAAMQSAMLGRSLPDGGTMMLGLVHVSMPSRSTYVGDWAFPLLALAGL